MCLLKDLDAYRCPHYPCNLLPCSRGLFSPSLVFVSRTAALGPSTVWRDIPQLIRSVVPTELLRKGIRELVRPPGFISLVANLERTGGFKKGKRPGVVAEYDAKSVDSGTLACKGKETLECSTEAALFWLQKLGGRRDLACRPLILF